MILQRELRQGTSEFAQRVEVNDQNRLVRDRLFLLKKCIIQGKDSEKEPFLYALH